MKNFAIVLFLSLLSACASDLGINSYTTEAAGEVNKALKGTIISVRTVNISDEGNGGSIIGGVAGAAAGTLVGSSDATQIIGGALGAAAGSWAGSEAQQLASQQMGYEYVVELQNGSLLTLTQGADVKLNVGQKCIVLYGKRSRIIPYGNTTSNGAPLY